MEQPKSTEQLLLENIQQQVTEINISFKEFKADISSKVSGLNDKVVTLTERDSNRGKEIERLSGDINGIRCKAEIEHKDINNKILDTDNKIDEIDKKIARYIGWACGAFAIISIGIQFALKLIK